MTYIKRLVDIPRRNIAASGIGNAAPKFMNSSKYEVIVFASGDCNAKIEAEQ
jgi:hypothetical protein